MYCPKCGQQQVADNSRFCSRCGLPISGLAEWLAGGAWPAVRAEVAPPAVASPRRKGIRRGAKLMFLSGVLLPIFFGLCFAVDSPGPLFVPFTIFLAGLSWLLYSRLFGDELPPAKALPAQPYGLGPMFGGNALPPASSMWQEPVGRQRARTTEEVGPPSVTEHTTKLLDND